MTQAARALSGKDVKVLRANVQAAFPYLRIDQVDARCPSPRCAATTVHACPLLRRRFKQRVPHVWRCLIFWQLAYSEDCTSEHLGGNTAQTLPGCCLQATAFGNLS